ncbi:MAG TPA: hypothetical protein VK586_24150 [Streptosporangiaceae bacterium]|nr:hypothetical protein [Streptosporangiaceae bacterium]
MTELDETLLAAVRESSIALKPGDVLAVRLPLSFNSAALKRARDHGHAVERETGIKVVFIPGEEFAATTVNITVNATAADPGVIADEIRKVLAGEMRRGMRRPPGTGIMVQ